MKTRDQGFTLVELLAAMAILAVVSVMAVQALGGVFMQRSVLTRMDQEGAALARALAILRADLEAAAPVPLINGEGEFGPAITVSAAGFAMSRSGLSALDGPRAIGQVTWGASPDGTLWRQVFVDPVQQIDPGPRVPVLQGISGLTLIPRGGGLPDADDPATLPPGFEVTMTHATHGPLRIVVAR